jgi:hypothetical protein
MKNTQSTHANRTKQHPGSTDSPASKRGPDARASVTPGGAAWTRYADSRLKLFGHIR